MESAPALLGWVWRTSWQGAILVVLAAGLCRGLGRLSYRWRRLVWVVVLARLLLPVIPASPLSVFNLAGSRGALGSGPGPNGDAPAPEPARLTTATVAGARSAGDSRSPANPAVASVPAPALGVRGAGGGAVVLLEVWALGCAVMLGRGLGGGVRLRRFLRRCRPAGLAEVRATAVLEACRCDLGLRRRVDLLVSEDGLGPAVAGVLRPCVILPRGLIASLGEAELAWMVRHELMHVRRQDVALSRLWGMARAVHWFNPLVWWAWRQARACAEFACDEAVLAGNETPARAVYGQALLRAAELPWAAKPTPGAVGALIDRAGLVARLDRVLAPPRQSRTWAVASGVLLLVLAAATLTDAAPAKAGSAAVAKALTAVTPPPASTARTLRWRVTGPDGRPAAGAALHVSIWSPDAPRKGSQDYVCDAGGEVVLQLPDRVDILRVWSSAPGCVSLFTHWERQRPADSPIPTEFALQLPPGTVVGGKVVDEEGRPVVGASGEVALQR